MKRLSRKKVRTLPELQALPSAERRNALLGAALTGAQVGGWVGGGGGGGARCCCT